MISISEKLISGQPAVNQLSTATGNCFYLQNMELEREMIVNIQVLDSAIAAI